MHNSYSLLVAKKVLIFTIFRIVIKYRKMHFIKVKEEHHEEKSNNCNVAIKCTYDL